jgi:succinylglutamic semialdehyde dehydrogenase
LEVLMKMMQSIKVGAYTDRPEPFMGPVCSSLAADKLVAKQAAYARSGGEMLVEMRRLKSGTGLLSPGLMDVSDMKDRPDEEIFGPFLQVVKVADFNSSLREANHTAFGLSAGILTDSPQLYAQFYRQVHAGIINWNTQLTGASSFAPFGGVGISGNHRSSAYYAADYCAYPVASMESTTISLPQKLAPGITPWKESLKN